MRKSESWREQTSWKNGSQGARPWQSGRYVKGMTCCGAHGTFRKGQTSRNHKTVGNELQPNSRDHSNTKHEILILCDVEVYIRFTEPSLPLTITTDSGASLVSPDRKATFVDRRANRTQIAFCGRGNESRSSLFIPKLQGMEYRAKHLFSDIRIPWFNILRCTVSSFRDYQKSTPNSPPNCLWWQMNVAHYKTPVLDRSVLVTSVAFFNIRTPEHGLRMGRHCEAHVRKLCYLWHKRIASYV
jgi:hypothetical protein